MIRKRFSYVLAAAIAASMISVAAPASAVAGCADTSGGDWTSYGQSLTNTRDQVAETAIGTDNVSTLETKWSIETLPWESTRSSPVFADGCVYYTSYGPGIGIGTSATATITAANAETGEVLWQVTYPALPTLLPGAYSPAVADGMVFVAVGEPAVPFVVALDQETGEEIWATYLYNSAADADLVTGITSSMVPFNGMLFVPFTGADAVGLSHPSFYILDMETGMMLKKTLVIEQEYWLQNFAGGGIWATPAVDLETQHLYVGTANPYNKRQEHPRTNAILKIDVNPKRFTFGEIVSSYKGDLDYNEELYNTPECRYLAELVLVGFSFFCGQQDVDFGSSPNLFTDSEGRTIIGNFQKSGTYHAVDTETMEPVWHARELAEPAAGGNAASSAWDETGIYLATDNGRFTKLDLDTGAILWDVNTGDLGGKYQPVTLANGIAYTLENTGELIGLDQATGTEVLRMRPTSATDSCESSAGSGVIVAGGMLYATCDSAASGGGAIFAIGLPSA